MYFPRREKKCILATLVLIWLNYVILSVQKNTPYYSEFLCLLPLLHIIPLNFPLILEIRMFTHC